MTLGFEAGLEAEVTALNARRLEQAELFAGPPARLVSAPGAEVAVLARGSRAAPRLVLALNPNPDEASALPAEVVLPEIGGAGGTLVPLDEAEPAHGPIAAGGTFEMGPAEARAFRFVPAKPIRRANPALHSHRGLEFLNAFDDAVLYYAKSTPDGRNTLLVAVNLDPRRAVETDLEIPFWRFGLPDEAAIGAEDLMRARSLIFRGKRQRVRLDPNDLPFVIWRLENPGGRRYGQAS